MNGREEREAYFNNRCDRIIKDSCAVVRKYFTSFKNGRTAATRTTYLSMVNQYVNYLKRNGMDVDKFSEFSSIKPADIDEYLDLYKEGNIDGNHLRKSDASVQTAYSVLKSFYQFLYNNEYITKDPFTRVNKPKSRVEKSPVYLTEKEVQDVKDKIFYSTENYYNNAENKEYWQFRDYTIFTLGCRTGLRRSAISEINIEDINFDENYILVTEKGNVTRECYFGDSTKELLKEWLIIRQRLMGDKECDALFISKYRKRINPVSIGRMIDKYTCDMDKHITPHKMRSTCATNLWEKTGDIYLVADQLGHKNLSNTRKYTNISSDKKRKAAAILDEL